MNRLQVFAALAAGWLGVAGAAAQSRAPWGPPDSGRMITTDVLRPAYDGADLSFASGLVYAGGRVPIGGGWAAVGEVPYARFAVGDLSGTVLGNLYVGIQRTRSSSSSVTADLGVRLPTSNESGDLFGDATFAAAYSDFDHAEAWLDEMWAVVGRVGYRRALGGGFGVGLGVGGSLWVVQQAENEALADYRVNADYRESGVAIGAEFTGRAIVTESGLDFAQMTIHQMALGAGMRAGVFWPRLWVRFPLDDGLKDVGLNQVVGLAVDWRF